MTGSHSHHIICFPTTTITVQHADYEWAMTSTTDVQERTTLWRWGSGREHERGNGQKASVHGTSAVFYFLLILLIILHTPSLPTPTKHIPLTTHFSMTRR